MCALGQPAHIPFSRTSAELPFTSINSISPPSAWRNGRTRFRTLSTRSLEIIAIPRMVGGATDVPVAATVFGGFGGFSAERAWGNRGLFRGCGDYPASDFKQARTHETTTIALIREHRPRSF